MKRTKYNLTIPLTLEYFNVLGIDEETYDLRFINLKTNNLKTILPNDARDLIPLSSYTLNKEYLKHLNKLFKIKDRNIKEEYLNSIRGILNTSLNINLIEPIRDNPHLLFERINTILISVMSELNKLSVKEIITLFNYIKNYDYNTLKEYSNKLPITYSLIYLSLNQTYDIKEYNMFINSVSPKLNYNNLSKLVKENQHQDTTYEFDTDRINRLSYIKSLNNTK